MIIRHIGLAPLLALLFQAAAMGQAKSLELYKYEGGEPFKATYTGRDAWLAEQKDPRSHLHRLPQLEAVELLLHDISPGEMQYVAGLKQLRHLKIGECVQAVDCEVGVMQSLARCRQLESLEICKTDLTDAELRLIGQLLQLSSLKIEGESLEDGRKKDQVTEDGLAAIASLPDLEELYLQLSTDVSDRFVERLAKLPKLSWLTMSSNRLTDKTIDTIALQMKLEQLDISSSQFTAGAIQRLKEVRGIEDLHVNGELVRLRERPSKVQPKVIVYSP